MKPTKRKAFNFLRSYFDVFNELKEDKDKLDFLTSIINKQFLNEDPQNLSFIVKLCYESQRHSIESSVKGWLRVNNTDVLGNPMTNPTTNPTTNITTNITTNPIQVEEKEKEQYVIQPKVVIDWDALLVQFNQLTKRNHKLIPDKAKRQLLARLKDGYTKQDIWNAIQNCYNDEYHKETNHKYLTLEFISRPDKMERYSVDVVKTKNIDKSKIGML